MLGCGVVGTGAAELAAAFGNEVRILDVNMNTMLAAKRSLPRQHHLHDLNRSNLEKCGESDARHHQHGILAGQGPQGCIVYREDLKLMKPGAMIVDVACDETAPSGLPGYHHDDPIYFVDGVMHYCVDNGPSAFSQTASMTTGPMPHPCLSAADGG